MMRKVFWCGVLLAGMAATGVYLAADFARRHPERALVPWAGAAYHGHKEVDSLVRLGQALAIQDPNVCPVLGTLETESAAALDVPGEPPAVIDLTALPFHCVPGQGEPYPASEAPVVYAVADLVVPATVGPLAVELDEDAYRVMPPCLDDEKVLPALMPYAEEADTPMQPTPCVGLGCPKVCPVCPCSEQCSPAKLSTPGPNTTGDAEEQEPKLSPPRPISLDNPSRSWPVIPPQVPTLPMIDTTEFRPSDARQGEFERSPL